MGGTGETRRRMLRRAAVGLAAGLAGRLGLEPGAARAASRWSGDPGQWSEADPPVAGPRLRIWTTETGADRLAVIRYLLDVQATLIGNPVPIFEPVEEHEVVARMHLARRPGSRVPMPHIVNTGADSLMALHADGLLSEDGGRVVTALGPDTFAEGALAALRGADGAMAGVPFHGWPQILWVRKDWLAVWSMDPPETVDDLIRAARMLHDPRRGQRGIILGTTGDFYTQQCFMMIARAFGGSVFDLDGIPSLNTYAMIEALGAYRALARFAGPGDLTWRARDYYLQGRAGMLFYSTFLMDDLAIPGVAENSLTGDNFDDLDGARFNAGLVRATEPIATLDGAGGIAAGAFCSINGLGLTGIGTQQERIAARSLALFLFRRDAYISWLHMAPGGMLPVIEGTLADDAFMRDRLGVFQSFGWGVTRRFGRALRVPATFSVTGHGDKAYAVPFAGRLYADGVVGRMVARVLAGDMEPPGAAARAQAEALLLLAQPAGHR